MGPRLRAIAADFRRGRHLDVYLAVVAAFLFGILGLFGVTSLRWIGPVLLLCLVPLLALILSINDQVGEGIKGTVAIKGFPTEPLVADWARDTEVLLVGVTLFRTIRSHDNDLRRRLNNAKKVRVLIVDPKDKTSMALTDDRRQNGPGNAANNAAEAGLSLADLRSISAAHPGPALEVRTIKFPIGLGGFFFSPNGPNPRLYVETYPFRTSDEHPHFVVTRQDEHWLEHFSLELENMWQAGQQVIP